MKKLSPFEEALEEIEKKKQKMTASISIEKDLHKEVSRLASKLGISISDVYSRGAGAFIEATIKAPATMDIEEKRIRQSLFFPR